MMLSIIFSWVGVDEDTSQMMSLPSDPEVVRRVPEGCQVALRTPRVWPAKRMILELSSMSTSLTDSSLE